MNKHILLGLLLMPCAALAMEKNQDLEESPIDGLIKPSPIRKEENDGEIVYERDYPPNMCMNGLLVVCRNGISYDSNVSKKKPCRGGCKDSVTFKYGQVDHERDEKLFKELVAEYAQQEQQKTRIERIENDRAVTYTRGDQDSDNYMRVVDNKDEQKRKQGHRYVVDTADSLCFCPEEPEELGILKKAYEEQSKNDAATADNK